MPLVDSANFRLILSSEVSNFIYTECKSFFSLWLWSSKKKKSGSQFVDGEKNVLNFNEPRGHKQTQMEFLIISLSSHKTNKNKHQQMWCCAGIFMCMIIIRITIMIPSPWSCEIFDVCEFSRSQTCNIKHRSCKWFDFFGFDALPKVVWRESRTVFPNKKKINNRRNQTKAQRTWYLARVYFDPLALKKQ